MYKKYTIFMYKYIPDANLYFISFITWSPFSVQCMKENMSLYNKRKILVVLFHIPLHNSHLTKTHIISRSLVSSSCECACNCS